jgi:signal transduction histidine kinase/ActR/RegA family two-component response regulator
MCPFPHEIDAARVRLNELQENLRALGAPALTRPAVLDDLQRALDQLRQTDAELERQNAALQGARAELEAQRQRYQTLFEFAPNGLLATDPQGRVVLLNGIAAAILGTPRDAAVGRALASLSPAIAALAPADGPESRDVAIAAAGLPSRIVRVTTTSIAEGPERGGHVVLLDDVTAEREAKRRLEEQDRLAATGQLAAGMAHDFNNLLSVVIGFADLLRASSSLPEDVRSKLSAIAEHGRRGSRLIRQILDFSRRSVTEPQPVDVRTFLADVASLLERTLPENVALHLALAEGEQRVLADPTQLQHLVTNLALNARDAMPRGGHLRLELARSRVVAGGVPPLADMPPGEWIALTVADSGTGIPADVQAHVFEPFFTTKPRHQGTGLGLAQVYGIVKQQNGFIQLASVPGWGTRFTVYLPVLIDAPAAPAPVEVEPLPHGHGETVLLVEDDPATCEVNGEALRYLGYDVLAAATAEAALELWERHRDDIAVVLTDLVMPGMGGAELYRALRRRHATVPVVVASGYPLGVDRGDPSLEGIAQWLPKPADIEDLARAIHRAMLDHLSDEPGDARRPGASPQVRPS